MITSAPARARARALAPPMAPPPPVTSATLPERSWNGCMGCTEGIIGGMDAVRLAIVGCGTEGSSS